MEFREALYEATLYAFGKILAKYDAFAQGAILREVGRDVLEFLGRHGFEFNEAGSLEDLPAMVDHFVRNGFCEKVESEPAEHGQRFTWHRVYGFEAYKELLRFSDNPFLSCPLNAALAHLAYKHGKILHLREKAIDATKPIIVSAEELVEATDSEAPAGSGLDPLAVENARLYSLLEERARELEKILSEIKTLRGMLPICANCKKIRDDNGYWNRLEHYVEDHTGARFTHGLCPDCLAELYPEAAATEGKPEKVGG